MTLPTIVSFWHGPLSWLEVMCINSFLRQGHPIAVYSFDPIENLPEGAQWRDAAEVLPREKLVFYKGNGTPAVFSDWFRLELLKRSAGVYVDLDVYCLKPINISGEYLFAWETNKSINNAVLFVAPDAPLLSDLLAVFNQPGKQLLIPYLPPVRKLEVALRRMMGEALPPENMQFGATGPMPLTYYVKERGLADRVLPASTFYPVPYEKIPTLMKSGSDLTTFVRPETVGIHLWRSQLTDRGRADLQRPEQGSALASLQQGLFT